MVLISEIVLVTRNARDKVQVAITSLSQEGNAFIINRKTGQYQGKMTEQPELFIEKGKAKRSVIQQAELEFNSIVKKYMDKGYKKYSDLTLYDFNKTSAEDMDEIVPTLKTDTSGNLKPMLAKDFNKCQNSVLQRPMRCSRKLDGVRCMMLWDKETNEVRTVSRGGQNYDVSSKKLMDEVHEYLFENQDIILDGELYAHGHYLQEISGIARLKTWEDRCDMLEYWIYDVAIHDVVFEERYNILMDLQEYFEDSKKIKVLDHHLTEGWEQIQKLHDEWVAEGYEGLVARKLDKQYEFGKRSSTMVKVKMYQEDDFEIVDHAEKLREEDFCFICQTKDGKLFEAKPIGTREIRARYLEDMNDIIGRKGTIKFFDYSKEGIPMQPIFQAVRYDLD